MSGKNSKPKATKAPKFDLANILVKSGVLLIGGAAVIFVVAFFPSISEEVKFFFFRPDTNVQVTSDEIDENTPDSVAINPADENFGLIIPKIGANSKVVEDVDPYDSAVYQQALTQGVAHAAGTNVPGEEGNTFIFSHSSVNFYEANRFNSVFYLLRKLEIDDTFFLSYQGELFEYKVTETRVVDAEAIEYLTTATTNKQATLMTCWPPGTTLKRFVVIGEQLEKAEETPIDAVDLVV